MGRLVSIIVIALAVWVVAEVYTKGVDGAFGGMFASWNDPIVKVPDTDGRTLGQQVGEHVQTTIDDAFERRNYDAD